MRMLSLGSTLITLALLGSGLSIANPALAQVDDAQTGRSEIASILDRSRGASPAQRRTLVREIARLDALFLPSVFQELVTAGSTPQGELLLEGLVEMDREGLLSFLAEAAEGMDPLARVAGLRILSRVGMATDWALALDLARGPRDATVARSVATVLEEATAAILNRDPVAWSGLARQLPGTPRALAAPLIRGAGRVGGVRALDFFTDMLGVDPEQDSLLLLETGQVALGRLVPAGEAVCARVRPYLQSGDPLLVREAALAVGKLRDFESVQVLIEQLESENRGLRETAHWSLREMSGRTYRLDPRPWKSWYAMESRWFQDEAPSLFEDLKRGEPQEVFRAVDQLALRRLHNDRIAAELCALLHDDDEALRSLVCRALRQLNSTAAVMPLIESLDDASGVVRTEAWTTLRAITSEDLPPDPGAWIAALAG